MGRFIDVCQAIEYAHSRGVLHRDLKPGNIMLGRFGETLVVDWGLAKVQGRSPQPAELAVEGTLRPASGSEVEATQMGATVGTLGYMSPEQAHGRLDLLGPTADVFSLGATLYHLLTDRPPFIGATRDELIRKCQDVDFPSPRSVRAEVPPALEAICLKALAREPKDRYATPLELADDLEHWLADEPISARADSPMDRIARWVRRHRAAALSAVLSLLMLLAAASVTAVVVNRAREQNRLLAQTNERLAEEERQARQLAEARRGQAVARFRDARAAVDTWLSGASETMRFYPGLQLARLTLLKRAAADLDRLSRAKSDDAELELERGRAWMRLGELHAQCGAITDAGEAYSTSESILTKLPELDPNLQFASQLETERVHVKQAALLQARGNLPDAEMLLSNAAARLDTLSRQLPNSTATRGLLAAALLNRGAVLLDLQRSAEAQRLIRTADDALVLALQGDPSNLGFQRNRATAAAFLARVALEEGRFREACDSSRRAQRELDRLLFAVPDQPDYLQARAAAGIELAAASRSIGQYRDELSACQASCDDYATLVQLIPDNLDFVESLALTRVDLAQVTYRVGRCLDAQHEIELAVADLDRLVDVLPDQPRLRVEQATAKALLGLVLGDMGERQPGLVALNAARQTLEQVVAEVAGVPDYEERLAVVRSHIGQCLAKDGSLPAARKAMVDSLSGLQGLAEQYPAQARYRVAWAETLECSGDMLLTHSPADGLAAHQHAGRLWAELAELPDAIDDRRKAAWFYANCQSTEVRDPARALKLAQRAAEQAGDEPIVQTTLALALWRADKPAESVAAAKKAQLLQIEPGIWESLILAAAQQQLGEAEASKQSLSSAEMEIRKSQPGNPALQRMLTEVKRLVNGEP